MEGEIPVEEKIYQAKMKSKQATFEGDARNMSKSEAKMPKHSGYKPEKGMLSSDSEIIQKKNPNYKDARYQDGMLDSKNKIVDKFSANYKDDRYK